MEILTTRNIVCCDIIYNPRGCWEQS